MERALAIRKETDGSDYSCLADQLYALAALMVDAGKPSLAVEYANKAVSLVKMARNVSNRAHLVCVNWYCRVAMYYRYTPIVSGNSFSQRMVSSYERKGRYKPYVLCPPLLHYFASCNMPD